MAESDVRRKGENGAATALPPPPLPPTSHCRRRHILPPRAIKSSSSSSEVHMGGSSLRRDGVALGPPRMIIRGGRSSLSPAARSDHELLRILLGASDPNEKMVYPSSGNTRSGVSFWACSDGSETSQSSHLTRRRTLEARRSEPARCCGWVTRPEETFVLRLLLPPSEETLVRANKSVSQDLRLQSCT
ncbi:hypothetical protein MUK42_30160 [Musa troglodytarum]|uniref:Uncharacterized protein n=1 Tax=Musa troglodytarum TaxID=320322 RepID=A0A9E7GBU6_9LILI|nr:hypothetical protein MUK42_30160 [Musa troglodytarum]